MHVCVGPDRRIFLPDGLLDRSEIPEYLNGEVPGEYVNNSSIYNTFIHIFVFKEKWCFNSI